MHYESFLTKVFACWTVLGSDTYLMVEHWNMAKFASLGRVFRREDGSYLLRLLGEGHTWDTGTGLWIFSSPHWWREWWGRSGVGNKIIFNCWSSQRKNILFSRQFIFINFLVFDKLQNLLPARISILLFLT